MVEIKKSKSLIKKSRSFNDSWETWEKENIKNSLIKKFESYLLDEEFLYDTDMLEDLKKAIKEYNKFRRSYLLVTCKKCSPGISKAFVEFNEKFKELFGVVK